MLGLVPPFPVPTWLIKLGAVAIAAGALAWWAYDAGQDSKQSQMDALRQSYEVAAAQAAARESERLRMWTNAVTVAGAKYEERAKVADASFDSSLDRLRNAYSSVKGVRFAAPAAGECPAAGGPTAGDILKQGEELAAILRDADKVQSALISCAVAHPR